MKAPGFKQEYYDTDHTGGKRSIPKPSPKSTGVKSHKAPPKNFKKAGK